MLAFYVNQQIYNVFYVAVMLFKTMIYTISKVVTDSHNAIKNQVKLCSVPSQSNMQAMMCPLVTADYFNHMDFVNMPLYHICTRFPPTGHANVKVVLLGP